MKKPAKQILFLPHLFLFFLCLTGSSCLWPHSATAMPMQQASLKPIQKEAATTPSTPLTKINEVLEQQIQALVTNGETTEIEPQETFGTRVLGLILTASDMIRNQSSSFLTNFAALPQILAWFDQQVNDAPSRARWTNIGELLLKVLGGALIPGILAQLLLTPARRHLSRRESESFSLRLATSVSWLISALLPILLFVGTALYLMNLNDPPRLTRFVVMNVVYALVLDLLVRLVVKFIVAPKAPALRLVGLSDAGAQKLQSWVGYFSFVMIYGYFLVDVAHLVKVPVAAITAFNSVIGLVIVLMGITLTIQQRDVISNFLRGDLAHNQPDLTLWEILRLWLARNWHRLVILYLAVGYSITIMSVGDGFTRMLEGTIITLLLLIMLRLSTHGISRLHKKIAFHVRILLQIGLLALAALGIASAWGFDISNLLASPWGQRLIGSSFTITVSIIVATLIYESLQGAIKRQLKPREMDGRIVPPSARLRTLLPLARNAALIVLSTVVALITLSELGFNIAPLLAGAGVIGVAIGFGSQSLVKDFITGLFIIMEDTLAVGDFVRIGDLTGVVESMTIRTLRLRAANGALHVLPFGEVTKVTNETKDFSYAMIDINVSYQADLRHVMTVMQEVGAALAKTPPYSAFILAPLEMFGIEKFAESSVQLRGRIKTKPGQQWDVRYTYMLLLKERFDKEGIEIPYPTMIQVNRGVSGSTV